MSNNQGSGSFAHSSIEELLAAAQNRAAARFAVIEQDLLPSGLKDALDITDIRAAVEKKRAAKVNAAEQELNAAAQAPVESPAEPHEGEEGELSPFFKRMKSMGGEIIDQMVLGAIEAKEHLDHQLYQLKELVQLVELSRIILELTPPTVPVEWLKVHLSWKEKDLELTTLTHNVRVSIHEVQSVVSRVRSTIHREGWGEVH